MWFSVPFNEQLNLQKRGGKKSKVKKYTHFLSWKSNISEVNWKETKIYEIADILLSFHLLLSTIPTNYVKEQPEER